LEESGRLNKLRRWLWRAVLWILALLLCLYLFCAAGLVVLRWIDPPTTAVQAQRRIESWLGRDQYKKRYMFVPLERIPRDFQHAVVAAEDGRFYHHHGIDWQELEKVVNENLEAGKLGRGASTITQQLIKNLFFTTSRSAVRKAAEFTLAPLAEVILSKQRIFEIYLNVIEWGPGVYGADQAARYHYKMPVAQLSREQAARLAACIPAPRTRRPARMNEYSAVILDRMQQRGW